MDKISDQLKIYSSAVVPNKVETANESNEKIGADKLQRQIGIENFRRLCEELRPYAERLNLTEDEILEIIS